MLNQKTLKLEPTLRIGAHTLADYESLYRTDRTIILDSLDSLVPLKQFCLGVEGKTTAAIVGPLRNAAYPGVLYIELSQGATEQVAHPSLIYFQAFRQTLDHCLTGV